MKGFDEVVRLSDLGVTDWRDLPQTVTRNGVTLPHCVTHLNFDQELISAFYNNPPTVTDWAFYTVRVFPDAAVIVNS